MKAAASYIAFLSIVIANQAPAFTGEEHQILADSAFSVVLCEVSVINSDSVYSLECGDVAINFSEKFWNGRSFGTLVAELAKDDFAEYRFHERGQTVMEQLQSLSRVPIDEVCQLALTSDTAIFDTKQNFWASGKDDKNNVVASYLIYHLAAIQLAANGSSPKLDADECLRRSLMCEALAQGFLADCFSSGHMVLQRDDPLAAFHRRNLREAHRLHSLQGIFVINASGDVWQAFGDNVLFWYEPTYYHLLEASLASLREVLAAFYLGQKCPIPQKLKKWLDENGPAISAEKLLESWLNSPVSALYNTPEPPTLLPTLMHLPMPVTASWSMRIETNGLEHVHRRHHYPQLSNSIFHDSSLDHLDKTFLYDVKKLPAWMVPKPLQGQPPVAPQTLVRTDPDWASVQFLQDLYPAPSYKGGLVQVGCQWQFKKGQQQPMFGLGLGLIENALLIKNVDVGINYHLNVTRNQEDLLSATFGCSLPSFFPWKIAGWIDGVRIEGGPALNVENNSSIGSAFAVGVVSKPVTFGFTYAAVSLQIMYVGYTPISYQDGVGLRLIVQ